MFWVNVEKCVGCGDCAEECPVDVITIENEKAHINNEDCIECGTCESVCPENAIQEVDEIPE